MTTRPCSSTPPVTGELCSEPSARKVVSTILCRGRTKSSNSERPTASAVAILGAMNPTKSARRHAHRRRDSQLSHLCPDDLGLQVALNAGLARFVAPAGLLVATERHRVVVGESAVEPDGSGLESLG